MRAIFVRLTGLAVALVCAGCANMNSVFRTFHVDEKESLSIDAKQRTVIVGVRAGWTDGSTTVDPKTVVCAEPSPDAFSVLGASFGGSAAETQQLALKLAFATNEAGANIGLRTQTITILRDAMYRLCEGYMSGALSESAFERLQRRYQNAMLGFLAIEQLTGAVTPKPTIIQTTAPTLPSTGDGQEKPKQPGKQTGEASTANPTLTAELNASTGATTSKKQKTGRDPVASSAAAKDSPNTPAPNAPGGHTGVSDTVGTRVADAVENIVKAILGTDYTLETCLNYVLDQTKQTENETAVQFCNNMITIANTKLKEEINKTVERAAKPISPSIQ